MTFQKLILEHNQKGSYLLIGQHHFLLFKFKEQILIKPFLNFLLTDQMKREKLTKILYKYFK